MLRVRCLPQRRYAPRKRRKDSIQQSALQRQKCQSSDFDTSAFAGRFAVFIIMDCVCFLLYHNLLSAYNVEALASGIDAAGDSASVNGVDA